MFSQRIAPGAPYAGNKKVPVDFFPHSMYNTD